VSLEFVDTNVLLYAYDGSAGDRHAAALELVRRLGSSRRGAISIQVLQEFYVNAARPGVAPNGPEGAAEYLEALARWPVHSPLPGDVVAAARIARERQLSFWDAMIVRSAEQMGCQTLWTEDLNSGQVINSVRIANPFA
jgi:predicted nucleic acid-binding protein